MCLHTRAPLGAVQQPLVRREGWPVEPIEVPEGEPPLAIPVDT